VTRQKLESIRDELPHTGVAQRGSPLGDDAHQPEFGGGLKEPGAVALEVVTELDWGAWVTLDQFPQKRPALQERAASQVLTVEVEKVEGKEHQPVRRRVDSRAQGMEIGDAVLVLDDHLAIDQSRFAGQPGAGIDNPLIGPRPVIAVAGEGTDLATFDDDQGAVTIVLDLVNPALAGWRLRDNGREFGLYKAE
jgi:hypothetical protein